MNELHGIYIDMGSTNTRVWLMRGLEVIASTRARLGVADSARDGSTERIRGGLRKLIEDLLETGDTKPSFAIGAGMIGSALGLANVPHIAAPTGETELTAAIQTRLFPEIFPFPFLLVPGIRVAAEVPSLIDFMRGEETVCTGLLRSGLLHPGSTLLNLGSHWKAIALDEKGQVASSVTSLSGELLQVARSQTILAGSVPEDWPGKLDRQSVEAGMIEQRQSGLPRALFCVRLLEQSGSLTPTEAFGFLCGAFIGADLENLQARKILRRDSPVAITGSPALASAWEHVLTERSIPATLIEESDREKALIKALHAFAKATLPPAPF